MMKQQILLTGILSIAFTTLVSQPAAAEGPCKSCQAAAHHHDHQGDHHGSLHCCAQAPRCCQDARICIRANNAPACFSEAGVRAFMTLFSAAAEKGVENATIRAFNATSVAAPCDLGSPAKDDDDEHGDKHDKDEKHGDDDDKKDDDHKKKDDDDKKKDDDKKGDRGKKPAAKQKSDND
ncbi:MAG: hypothetical protein ABI614_07630 [Planctomycetota bacterium]